MLNITLQELHNTEVLTPSAKAWAFDNIEYLNKSMTLLGSSLKVQKGEKEGFYTSVMYMQPADKVAAVTLCPSAKMSGCLKGCLISSGQLGMRPAQAAATKRTILFLLRREYFDAKLIQEITAKHKKHGKQLAVRLNGTSDIDFSDIYKRLPDVQFYEYTKQAERLKRLGHIKNLHLTYSGSAYSHRTINATAKAIRSGHNTALAFNTKNLERDLFKIPQGLVDFDKDDLRFKDGLFKVGALSRKGSSLALRHLEHDTASFFFNERTYSQLIKAVNL